MQKATVNKKDFTIEHTDDKLLVNGNALNWDVVNLNNGHFHILNEGKSYQAEIIKADAITKSVTLKINNNRYTVEVKDKFDLLLEKMGMSNATTNKVNNIKAPMPGLIINLKVAEGDIVKAGDQLLILEAMKMENILKSPGDGVIKKIKVKKGDSVEKNQVLIEF
ncbi:MAG: biotin/lipoyl-binding protein [Cyclobacteriaceae bacterium]|nr:biotin/lipoyl-binding protein [Cyclobacteriaceae bacterium]